MEEDWEDIDPEELYDLDVIVGHGHFGKVYRAKNKQTGDTVAIKIIPLAEDEEDSMKKLKKEINLIQNCDSEYVVQYLDSHRQGNELWIVMEYCDCGSLANIISKTSEPLEEDLIKIIMKSALLGLAYLHDKRMIHRDIKADNILITSDGKAKLADLGVAAQLAHSTDNRSTATGTPYWMAPELIKQEAYNTEVDVWSLGITAIECAEKKPPFFDMVPMRALFVIAMGDKPAPTLQEKEKWSPDFHDFLSQCLVKDAKQRASAKLLLDHPFITTAPSSEFLKDYTTKYLQMKEQRELEKQNRKSELRARQSTNKKKLLEINDKQVRPPSVDRSSRLTAFIPVCLECKFMKESIAWAGAPLSLNSNKIQNLSYHGYSYSIDLNLVIQLFNLFKDAKEGIERKTRVYRLRSHKDCFQGSDAVDWFIGKIKLNSRDEGVAIGELLMKLGLISHVLGCEPFQDNKMFYYRFKSVSNLGKNLNTDYLENALKLAHLSDSMYESINICNRKWKHKDHFLTFLGNEAVEWICATLSFSNRNDAVAIAQVMMDRSIFHHVNFVDTFADKQTLYRYYRDENKYLIPSLTARNSAFEKLNSFKL